MHEDLDAKVSDLGRLQGEHAALLAARDALEVERADEAAQVADLRDALATAEAALGSQDSARRLAEDVAARAEVSRLSGDLAALREELHVVTTDRNRLRKLAESCQRDVKKAHGILAARSGDAEQLQEQNQRLREDLVRKTKSLQDALEALSNAASSVSAASAASFGSHTHSHTDTIVVSAKSGSMSGRDLVSLQTLCNRLSETCVEQSAQVAVLKKQCLGLGKRVIELEAGTIPDFSDRAHEAREREAKQLERRRDVKEMEGLVAATAASNGNGNGSKSRTASVSDGSEPALAASSSAASSAAAHASSGSDLDFYGRPTSTSLSSSSMTLPSSSPPTASSSSSSAASAAAAVAVAVALPISGPLVVGDKRLRSAGSRRASSDANNKTPPRAQQPVTVQLAMVEHELP